MMDIEEYAWDNRSGVWIHFGMSQDRCKWTFGHSTEPGNQLGKPIPEFISKPFEVLRDELFGLSQRVTCSMIVRELLRIEVNKRRDDKNQAIS